MEGLKITGQFELIVRDTEGKVVDRVEKHNLITTAGKALISALVGGVGSPAAVTYLAVGTGATAPAAGDTTLGTELTTNGLGRSAATVTQVTTTTTNDTLQLEKTWSATGASAVTEIGAFNAASAGSMLGRQTFSAINTSNGFSLTLRYKFQFS